MNIFEGLFGYEKLMLLCGFILFVFALAAITVMIVQRRDFKLAMGLFVIAFLLMAFPGVTSIKISKDMVELDRIRAQPADSSDPAQQKQQQEILSDLEQRSDGNALLQAKVSDGYRAIGDIDKAYDLAQSVLRTKPSIAVQQTLIPVLTAKLNQIQAAVPAAPPENSSGETPSTSIGKKPSDDSPVPPAVTSAAPPNAAKQREIAAIAQQLEAQNQGVLPAASHIALANAYIASGQPAKARANVDAALRLNPRVQLNPQLMREVKADTPYARTPEG